MKAFIFLVALALVQASPIPEEDPEYLNTYGDILGGDDLEIDPLNAIVSRSRCWPGGVLHYTIASSYSSTERARIQEGIRDLVDSTRVNGRQCINIVPRSGQSAYVDVYKGSGCSSFIGRTGSRQQMSLASGCVTRHGTIMHEFLHAYGFYHEQSRSDRDDFVTIVWDNIQSGYERNFQKYSTSSINLLGTRYDYGSVMHYGPYGFAIDRSQPTIITRDPNAMNVIGQRSALSALDIERVQILYGCIRVEDSKYHQHLVGEQLNLCA